MAEKRADGIICYGGDPWGEPKRPGHLMARLAERTPVVYVEPSVSVPSLLKNWRTAFAQDSRARIRRAMSRRAEEVAPGFHLLSSLVLLPPQRLSRLLPARTVRALVSTQQRRVTRRANRAAARLGLAPVVWATYPLPLSESENPDGSLLVYDCMDRWSAFPDAARDPEWLERVLDAERSLISRADVIFCSAQGLYDSMCREAPGRALLLRNGVNAEHFKAADLACPADIANLPRPIVGYVGAVAEWLDFALLREAARLRPDWSFVLVGPQFRGRTMGDPKLLATISDIPNVHLLGARPYAEIPAYLSAFDVATIPFKIEQLTNDTNPIKVYEYLAAGLPVVSTPLPEVAGLAQVRRAASAEEFVASCDSAIAERHEPALVGLRRAIAEENSWDRRAETAWTTIGQVARESRARDVVAASASSAARDTRAIETPDANLREATG